MIKLCEHDLNVPSPIVIQYHQWIFFMWKNYHCIQVLKSSVMPWKNCILRQFSVNMVFNKYFFRKTHLFNISRPIYCFFKWLYFRKTYGLRPSKMQQITSSNITRFLQNFLALSFILYFIIYADALTGSEEWLLLSNRLLCY